MAPYFRSTRLVIVFAILLVSLIRCDIAAAMPVTHPGDLSMGDQYRLVFWTELSRDATSSNIADYNDFVTAAATSVPELNALNTTWTAIASTATVDARDNTSTNPFADGIGVPIYQTGGGDPVANDYADLWDGTLDESITSTKDGNVHIGQYTMWTGSTTAGVADPFPLGHSTSSMAGISRLDINDSRWVAAGVVDHTAELDGRFYAMSGVLTMTDPTIPNLIYDAATGEVVLDPDASSIFGYSLANTTNSFLPGGFTPISGGISNATTAALSEFGASASSGSIGVVFPTGLNLAGLQSLLTTNSVTRDSNPFEPSVPFDLIVLNAPAVPEPSTYAMAAIGLLGLLAYRRFR